MSGEDKEETRPSTNLPSHRSNGCSGLNFHGQRERVIGSSALLTALVVDERHARLFVASHPRSTALGAKRNGDGPEPAAPIAPAGSQAASAEEACIAQRDAAPAAGVPYGSWRTLVAYTRGAFTLVLKQAIRAV
jgi:hypothetical protein